jgi:hypothetical protein
VPTSTSTSTTVVATAPRTSSRRSSARLTICGTSGTYTFEGNSYRDTDWFETTITETSDLTWEAEAEFPVLIFIIQGNSGDCVDYAILGSATGDPCTLVTLSAPSAPAGLYWLWVGPSVFAGFPCGVEYVATLTCGGAQPCDVVCPPGSYIEQEPVCADEYVDIYNGGCNSTPNVFEAIECEMTICGTSGTYTFEGNSYRDTDWFETTITETSDLTWEAEAEFPVLIFIIQGNSGDCVDYAILGSATGDPCTLVTLSAPSAPAGLYWLWVGPSVFAGFPCGVEYVATLTCGGAQPCDVVCPPGSYIEQEPVCADEYVDIYNGGCNSTPNVFEAIECELTICGTSGTYTFEGNSYRDTDWFETTITETSDLTWEAEAEFPVLIFIIQGNSGDCVDYAILGSATGDPCTLVTLSAPSAPAGLYWLWVGPSVFAGFPCGVEYVATLTCGGAQPCDVVCPPGSYIEQEPVCADEYVDIYNGGCNSTPNVFEAIECEVTVCGTSGTYTFEGNSYRDTDWFETTITEVSDLVWEAEAEFPVLIFIIQGNSGDCVDYAILGSATGDPCTVVTLSAPASPAGLYWLWVGPSVFAGFPCGVEYVATLTCGGSQPCDVVCPPGAYVEQEPVCADEYVDIYNGGCNSTPFVFEAVECGWTICGTSGTYLFQGNSYRDTDWFEVFAEAGDLTWEAEAEFPLLLFVIQANSGDCVDYTILGSATGNPCEVVTLTFTVTAGNYWLWVGPSVFAGFPCGVEYVATITCAGGGCPDDVTILRVAPQDGIIGLNAGDTLIDARQPWDPADMTIRLGVGIDNSAFGGSYATDRDDRLVVDLGTAGLADCFALCETAQYPEGANGIASVVDNGDGTYLVTFMRAPTVVACTTLQYTGDGSYVTIIPLPGDLNGDGFSSSFEVLDLVNFLNNVADVRAWDEYSSDMDHSGQTNSIDVLRHIDLFNGAAMFAPGWNEASAPDCTDCP